MPTHYDAIVIGTGQAGPSLAVKLAASGRKTAILERKRFGGTCVNVGCIPTKTLVASARAIHMARRGEEFGFTVGGDVVADMRRVKARKDAIVRQSSGGVEGWLKATDNLTVVEGHGRFTGPHTVAVNGETLEAPEVFVNVGARAALPTASGAASVPYLTNTTVFDLEAVPEHLVVVGGSYIGLEFAQVSAMVAAPSRTRHTATTRSSPTRCWAMAGGGSRTGFPAMPSTPTRRWAAWD